MVLLIWRQYILILFFAFIYIQNKDIFFHAFMGTTLHTDDWKVSKSTLEKLWTTHFTDVKIHVPNPFSKFPTCE
jgi:hypothetical protein